MQGLCVCFYILLYYILKSLQLTSFFPKNLLKFSSGLFCRLFFYITLRIHELKIFAEVCPVLFNNPFSPRLPAAIVSAFIIKPAVHTRLEVSAAERAYVISSRPFCNFKFLFAGEAEVHSQ